MTRVSIYVSERVGPGALQYRESVLSEFRTRFHFKTWQECWAWPRRTSFCEA